MDIQEAAAYSQQLFARIPEGKMYHNKAHGEIIAQTCHLIATALDFSEEDAILITETGRWHDIACILVNRYKNHANFSNNYIRTVLAESNKEFRDFFYSIVWILEDKRIFFGVEKSKFDIFSLSSVVEAADYIGQCGHTCYLPMIKLLFQEFRAEDTYVGVDFSAMDSEDMLFYDPFVYDEVVDSLAPYLELKALSAHKHIFELNRDTRRLAKKKNIKLDDYISLLKEISNKDWHLPSWDIDLQVVDLEKALVDMSRIF